VPALEAANIPYGIGGAIVLFYQSVPRTTVDIDINIFVPESEAARVFRVLAPLHDAFADERAVGEVRQTGQTRVFWGPVFIDLFFVNMEFLESAATRTIEVPFADITIRTLSAEDLVICKAMFNRRKDWADVEQLLFVQGKRFDLGYTRQWLTTMVGDDDERVRELDTIAAEVAEWEASLPDASSESAGSDAP
jgi:hypothetical protein